MKRLIDQSWAIGDAEVPLPLPPGKMAPVSGLNAVLIQRMLDDEVADRLAVEKGRTLSKRQE